MISTFIFNETSPAAPGPAASSVAVVNAAGGMVAGVAGPLDDTRELRIVAELVGATGGTLDVYVQTSFDVGVTWYDYAHFKQLAAGAPAVIYSCSSAQQPTIGNITTIGKNLAPAMQAEEIAGGPWGSRMRLVMVAGANTSAGAAVKVLVSGQR